MRGAESTSRQKWDPYWIKNLYKLLLGVGFEPTTPFRGTDHKSGALDHSTNLAINI